ncbi:MAG TPA: hypothetical protein VHM01_02220 [Alphaproteobacteria bacterium]|nr:hypothetical protein [Alphaproteobacteria bacterium]
MTKHQTARVSDVPAIQTYAKPATIVRFPLVLSVRRSRFEERRRPSLALNILLLLALVLACVIWEATSERNEAAQDVRLTPITSTRAAALDDTGRAVG